MSDHLRDFLRDYWDSDQAVIQHGGDGVPNSYMGPATTTVCGVAWFTDQNGRRHVVVHAARVKAPSSTYGIATAKAFHGLTNNPSFGEIVSTVYPETMLPEALLKKHESGRKAERWPALKVAMHRAILADLLEPSHRAALADWYGEQGDMVSSSRCCEALLCLTAIRGA